MSKYFEIKHLIKTDSRFIFPRHLKDIDLINHSFTSRHNQNITSHPNTGISSRTFGSKLFVVEGQTAIFKTFDSKILSNVKEERINNEILCYHLAKRLGMNVAKCDYAHYDQYNGIISYNFLKENDKIVDGDTLLGINDSVFLETNTYFNYDLTLPQFAELFGYKLDKKQIMFEIYQLLVFDFLTFQSDRNKGNVNFVISDNTLSFAPLFDNEFAFATMQLSKEKAENKTYASCKEFIDNYTNSTIKMSVYGAQRLGYLKPYQEEAEDIVNLARKNPQYAEFLKKALSIDISAVIYELVATNQLKISPNHMERCIKCFEMASELIKNATKQTSTQNIDKDEIDIQR